MKLLLENWRKYLKEQETTPLFYRAEGVTPERVQQLINSIGKPYPRKGKGFFGSYITLGKANPIYMYGKGGQAKTPFGAIIEFEASEHTLDEAVFDSNTLPWLSVKNPEHQEVLKRNFGDTIQKYFPAIAEAQETFYNPEIAEPMLSSFTGGESMLVSPGHSNKYMNDAQSALGPVIEEIRQDPEIIKHWLQNGPQDEWIEGGNFRMPTDGSGTKVTNVKIYRLGEKPGDEAEIPPEEALQGNEDETPT